MPPAIVDDHHAAVFVELLSAHRAHRSGAIRKRIGGLYRSIWPFNLAAQPGRQSGGKKARMKAATPNNTVAAVINPKPRDRHSEPLS